MIDIKPAAKANIMLDMSNFDLFQLCKARFNYRVNMRRSLPTIQKNAALDRGGLVHKGFEAYYKGLAEGLDYAKRVENAILALRVAAANPEESNLETSETERLVKTLEQNLDYWRFEDEYLEILSVETPFAYTLYEDDDLRIIITGQIDLLVNKPAVARSSGYTNLPIDHKTFSREGPVLELSNQFQNYCVATNSNYLIVNRVGLHNPDAKSPMKPDDKFKRVPLSYDPDKLQSWKDNTIDVILNEYAICVSEQKWPMNNTSCLKFNRLCEYYEVCNSSGEEAKAFKLANNYIDLDPWDVTKKMED